MNTLSDQSFKGVFVKLFRPQKSEGSQENASGGALF